MHMSTQVILGWAGNSRVVRLFLAFKAILCMQGKARLARLI